MALPQALFPNICKIEMEKEGAGSASNIQVEVTNISISGGERTTEGIPAFGGAYVVKKNTMDDLEVELEVFITDTTFDAAFLGGSSTSDNVTTISIGDQSKYRIILLWTNDTTATTARSAIAAAKWAYRMGFAEAYAVTFEKESSAEDYLKGTISFKLAPKDASADDNIKIEYANESSAGGISAMLAYTSSTKWR